MHFLCSFKNGSYHKGYDGCNEFYFFFLLQGPFTVFAPTNDAFAALSPEENAALQKDPELLAKVLEYHVTDGILYSNKLYNDMIVPSLAPGLNMRVNTCYKRASEISNISKVCSYRNRCYVTSLYYTKFDSKLRERMESNLATNV